MGWIVQELVFDQLVLQPSVDFQAMFTLACGAVVWCILYAVAWALDETAKERRAKDFAEQQAWRDAHQRQRDADALYRAATESEPPR